MSMYELEHPFGQDMESLHGALLSGMLDQEVDIPGSLKVNYEDPIGGKGVGTLRLADWASDNVSAVYFPIFSDDPTWKLKQGVSEFEIEMDVKHRIFVRDMLGRGFPINTGNETVISSFLRFDVVKDGIVFVYNEDGTYVPLKAIHGTEQYNQYENWARRHSSVQALVELAAKY